MKQFQPPAAVFIDQRERRRMHATGNVQPARQPAHELRLAGAEFAAQRDDQPARCCAAKTLAERFGVSGTMGDDSNGLVSIIDYFIMQAR